MNRLIVALIAGAFATSAAAQGTAPATTDKDKAKMERAEKAKAKQRWERREAVYSPIRATDDGRGDA